MPGNFDYGSYGQEIHEMVEARALGMGQYSHNNQPCHHILYLFALLGDKETTQRNVRIVMEKGYGMDFFAGDEDNGEMGAWFVLSALGVFVTTPGTTEYVLGSPIFKHVKILKKSNTNNNSLLNKQQDSTVTGKDQYIEIKAPGTKQNIYKVTKVYMNDVEIIGPIINHNQLICASSSSSSSCVLYFQMEGDSGNNNNLPITVTVPIKTNLRIESNLQDNNNNNMDTVIDKSENSYINQLKVSLKHSQG